MKELKRTRIMSHPQDLHCISFHVLCVLAYAAAFTIYLHPHWLQSDDFWSKCAFIGTSAFMLGWISGIDVGVNFHNHTHRRIFRVPALNDWFGRLWPITGGWPSFLWHYAHVKVHHSAVLDASDWTVPRRTADGRFENYFGFALLHWPWRYSVSIVREFAKNPRLRRKALRECLMFVMLWSIPFWIDFEMGLLLWLLPHWIANVVIMGPGMYVQHAGCRKKTPDAEHQHSNTFECELFNLTMFNIGYHLVHHDSPLVHWSELPAVHAERRARMMDAGAHLFAFGYYGASRYFGLQSRDGLVDFSRRRI